jgi:hypothetical protein
MKMRSIALLITLCVLLLPANSVKTLPAFSLETDYDSCYSGQPIAHEMRDCFGNVTSTGDQTGALYKTLNTQRCASPYDSDSQYIQLASSCPHEEIHDYYAGCLELVGTRHIYCDTSVTSSGTLDGFWRQVIRKDCNGNETYREWQRRDGAGGWVTIRHPAPLC